MAELEPKDTSNSLPLMTKKAIEARAELKAWLEKYKPEGDADYSNCYYPEDHPVTTLSVDGAVVATVSTYGSITIQGE